MIENNVIDRIYFDKTPIISEIGKTVIPYNDIIHDKGAYIIDSFYFNINNVSDLSFFVCINFLEEYYYENIEILPVIKVQYNNGYIYINLKIDNEDNFLEIKNNSTILYNEKIEDDFLSLLMSLGDGSLIVNGKGVSLFLENNVYSKIYFNEDNGFNDNNKFYIKNLLLYDGNLSKDDYKQLNNQGINHIEKENYFYSFFVNDFKSKINLNSFNDEGSIFWISSNDGKLFKGSNLKFDNIIDFSEKIDNNKFSLIGSRNKKTDDYIELENGEIDLWSK